jgi:hypothetical protein
MLASHCLKKTATRSLSLALASSLVLAAALQLHVQAQIGPVPPEPKPPMENSVGKAFKKLLKNQKTDPATPPAPAKVDRNITPDDNYIPGGKSQVSEPGPKRPVSSGPNPTESVVKHPPLLVQPPLNNAKIDNTVMDSENPPVLSHPKLDDPTNPLGFADAEIKLKHLSMLIDQKRFPEAKSGLMQLRQTLVDITEAHIGLYKTLNQLPSARGQAELEKELALEFAQLRDRAMLETAKVYISERDYTKAVKELADVVKSQPRSKLGLRSYEMLQELGFTEKLQLTQ